MMDRIEAGERLAAIMDRAAASGGLSEEAQGAHISRLERAREGIAQPEPDRKPPSPEALAAIGIGVVMPSDPAPTEEGSLRPTASLNEGGSFCPTASLSEGGNG